MMVLDLHLCETPRTPENELAKAAMGEEAMTPTPEGLYNLPVEEMGPQLVDASQEGEGLPYAPEGWPTPEDKWTWRVGRRRNNKGFWQDRYLILPKRLQKGGRKVWFFSKKALHDYLTREFPDADLDRFFASFQWDVPCTPKGKTTFCGKRGREVEEDGNVASQEKICKAGNLRCGLETGKSNSLKAMNCDICCIENGFCRECSCILCGKATDQSVREFSSIRCEGKLNEEFVCGHFAHLECALLCHMAGVEKSVGLDMEYYCRRCDKKTDLMMHIEGLIHASGFLNVRSDVEKNLSLALRIMQGTQQAAGISLQKIISSALEKLHCGMNVEDIVELQQNLLPVNADRDTIMAKRDRARTERATVATKRDIQLTERVEKHRRLEAGIAEQGRMRAELERLQTQREATERERDELQRQLEAMVATQDRMRAKMDRLRSERDGFRQQVEQMRAQPLVIERGGDRGDNAFLRAEITQLQQSKEAILARWSREKDRVRLYEETLLRANVPIPSRTNSSPRRSYKSTPLVAPVVPRFTEPTSQLARPTASQVSGRQDMGDGQEGSGETLRGQQ